MPRHEAGRTAKEVKNGFGVRRIPSSQILAAIFGKRPVSALKRNERHGHDPSEDSFGARTFPPTFTERCNLDKNEDGTPAEIEHSSTHANGISNRAPFAAIECDRTGGLARSWCDDPYVPAGWRE